MEFCDQSKSIEKSAIENSSHSEFNQKKIQIKKRNYFTKIYYAIISIVENLATTGKFTQKVRHLDTKKIAQIHNHNISNLCAKKGFTYIE